MKWKDSTPYSQGKYARKMPPCCYTLATAVGDLIIVYSRHDEGWFWKLKTPGHYPVDNAKLGVGEINDFKTAQGRAMAALETFCLKQIDAYIDDCRATDRQMAKDILELYGKG